MKVRKKPIIVEAMRFDGTTGSASVIMGWADPHITGLDRGRLLVSTLEGDIVVDPGYWIIKGVLGEVYACNPEVFEKSYDILEE